MTTPEDHTPIRRLRERGSAPVPTELVAAANPLAIAFHVSASLDDSVGDVIALGSYWKAGRRKAREARDVLIAYGLWIKVRPDVTKPAEIRTVETRVTDRDLAELALEYPAGTRIETAGCTWVVDDAGRPILHRGEPPADLGLRRRWTETGPTDEPRWTETGPFAGQSRWTETGPTDEPRWTETGPFAGQSRWTETGPTDERPYIDRDLSEISVGEISERDEGAAPPRSARRATPRQDDEPDWARLLVRKLPWRAKGGRVPSKREASELAARFRAAIGEHGLDQADVQAWALDRLAAADAGRNPVRWVINAFEPGRLPEPGFAAETEAEPLDESPLPLADLQTTETAADKPVDGPDGPGGTHGAPQGESRAQKRSESPSDDGAAADSGEPGVSGAELASPEEVAARIGAARARLEQARQRRAREQRQRERQRLREAQKSQEQPDEPDGAAEEASQAS